MLLNSLLLRAAAPCTLRLGQAGTHPGIRVLAGPAPIPADLAILEARQVLHQHLALPHKLTSQAHDASEELRASIPLATSWPVVQAQVLRVVPVVQQVLRTLAEAKGTA